MRKVYVNVTTRLIISADEDVDIGEVLDDMNYIFESCTPGADIIDSEVQDYDIQDSK